MVLRLNKLLKKYIENIAIYAEQIGLNLYRKIINRKGNLDRKIIAPLASTHKKISNNINFLYFFFFCHRKMTRFLWADLEVWGTVALALLIPFQKRITLQ